MGIFDNGLSAAKESARVLGKSEESADRKSFNRDFGTADFDSFGGETQPGKEIEIARFTVPASTEYSWGYGAAENEANQGYLYVDLRGDDEDADGTPDPINGSLILAQETPTGRGRDIVAEYDTTRLSASKSDRNSMVALPEQVGHDLVTQDSSVALYLDANSADTIVEGNCDVIFPMTEYDLKEE